MRHRRQKRRFRLVGRFGFFARGDQVLLDADSRRDVAETENATDDPLVKVLRQRLAFEDASVFEHEQVIALLIIDDLAQTGAAGVAIANLGADAVENRRVVAPEQKFLGQLPHGAEQAVHIGDSPLPVDHQNATAGRFERRSQLRGRLRQIVLDARFVMDFARLDQQPALAQLLDDLDRLGRRSHRSVGAQIQAFERLDVGQAAAANVLPVKNIGQRALDVENRFFQQFVGGIPEALRSDPVGHHDAQTVRVDQQHHLLGAIERESFQAAHFFASSLLGALASK